MDGEASEVTSIEALPTETNNNEIILNKKKASTIVILMNSTKTFLIFIWFLIESILKKIYSRQKVIRNQVVLITGSGGSLGK